MMQRVYLIGSLRNQEIPHIADAIRKETGLEVFDDWFSPGPEADDYWRKYEQSRGRTYKEALQGWAGKHVFEFDKHHLDTSDGAILVLPAGKSGHLELGYAIGSGKPAFVFFPDGEPERWDVMYQFATGIAFSMDELIEMVRKEQDANHTRSNQ